MGETAPNAVFKGRLSRAIERLYRDYRAIYNTIMISEKDTGNF